MKIAIIGTSGKAGSLIAKEAIARNYEVTGFTRRAEAIVPKGVKQITKDILSITKEDLAGFDVVIDAFGTWTEETLPLHAISCMHLCDTVSGTEIRLLVMGGAGSLYMDKTHTLQLVNTPEFPKEYKAASLAQTKELEELRKRSDVRWTFFSPAIVFLPDGKRTGTYKLGGEELIFDEKGESTISYADYAIAMLDEAEQGRFIQKRFTAINT